MIIIHKHSTNWWCWPLLLCTLKGDIKLWSLASSCSFQCRWAVKAITTPHWLAIIFKIASKIINQPVQVAPTCDSVPQGLDLMKARDVVIYTWGKVFISSELVTSKVIKGDGSDRIHPRLTLVGLWELLCHQHQSVCCGVCKRPKTGCLSCARASDSMKL